MTVTGYNILVGVHFTQTHWASCMHTLCGDAYFTAQTEFAAVGESGGGVYINCGAVHIGGEEVSGRWVFRYDSFAVTRRVGSYMVNGT